MLMDLVREREASRMAQDFRDEQLGRTEVGDLGDLRLGYVKSGM